MMAFLSACCTKVGCPASDRMEVVIEGLNATDTPGVKVFSYVRNSGFSQPADSFSTRVYNSSYRESNRFFLPATMTYANDLRILIDSTAKVYEITDFVLEKSVCNHCIGVRDEYRTDPKSHLLNGIRVESGTIYINR